MGMPLLARAVMGRLLQQQAAAQLRLCYGSGSAAACRVLRRLCLSSCYDLGGLPSRDTARVLTMPRLQQRAAGATQKKRALEQARNLPCNGI